jgi:hypothetical protein
MVEWSIVVSLIVTGLILVVIEIFFVPGTTFVGLLGFLCLVIGVALSFRYFGGLIGWSVAAGSTAITGFVLYQSFRTNIWSRFSLKSTLTGGVHDGVTDQAPHPNGWSHQIFEPKPFQRFPGSFVIEHRLMQSQIASPLQKQTGHSRASFCWCDNPKQRGPKTLKK